MTNNSLVFIYCRVSTSRQAEQGNGLGAQAQRCTSKVKEWGFQIAKIYHEEGVSGATSAFKRPQMSKMFEDIRKTKKSNPKASIIVLCDEFSRLARDVEVHFAINTIITKDLKAELRFVSNDFDNSPTGKLLRLLYSGIAQMERDINAERVIQRMNACNARGNYVHGRAKIGYFYDHIGSESGKVQTPHPTNAPIVAEAMNLYAVGSLTSHKEVKEYLEVNRIVYEEGKRKGAVRKLHLSTVRTLLKNAWFYAGFIPGALPNKSSLCFGNHKPLITVEAYEAIELRLGIRNQIYHKASKDEYPLKGWLRCGHCGHLMTSNGQGSRGKNGKSYLYYQCHHKKCSHYKKGIPPSVVHSDFEKHLFRYRCPDDLYAQCKDEVLKLWRQRIGEHKMRLTTHKMRLRDIEHRLNQATHTLIAATEDYVRESVKKVMSELTTEKSKLEAIVSQKPENDYDVEGLVERLGWLLSAPEILWRKANLQDKRIIQNLLVPNESNYTSWGGFRKPQDPLESAANEPSEGEKSGMAHPKRFELLAS